MWLIARRAVPDAPSYSPSIGKTAWSEEAYFLSELRRKKHCLICHSERAREFRARASRETFVHQNEVRVPRLLNSEEVIAAGVFGSTCDGEPRLICRLTLTRYITAVRGNVR